MTPWLPIGIALAAMVLVGYAVARLTRDIAIGVASAILVLALALLVFGTIATAMFVPGGVLLVIAFVILVFRIFGNDRDSPGAA